MAIIKPEFPNVPRAQGIPPMPRDNSSSFLNNVAIFVLNVAQSAIWDFISLKELWIIVDSQGQIITDFDSLIEIEAVTPTSVSSAPLQRGSFASYNKVVLPKPITVVLVKAGSAQDMTNFVLAIERATNSTDLYTIITPAVLYSNMNLELCGYRQTVEEGSHIIKMELRMVEIREVAAVYTQTELKNAKDPQSKPIENGGGQQPITKEKASSALKQVWDFAGSAFTKGKSFVQGLFK